MVRLLGGHVIDSIARPEIQPSNKWTLEEMMTCPCCLGNSISSGPLFRCVDCGWEDGNPDAFTPETDLFKECVKVSAEDEETQ